MKPPPERLRQSFLDYNRDFRIRTSKVGCFLAFILMPAGTVLDWFVYPELHTRFLVLRLVCAALAGILWLLLSWPQFARRWFRELGLSWFLLPSAFICWMIYEADGVQSPYYAGLTLVLIAVSWVAQVTVAESATAFVLTLLMYLAACFGHGTEDTRLLFNNLYFIVLTGLVMLTGNYFLNSMRFREFSLRHEVDAARREIETSHRRLLELDQMKSRFFANISHELRTPLTLLLAPLERLKSTHAPAAETRELLGIMHANALRLLKLINDLLDLVRMQSGPARLHRRAVDLVPFLQGLARSVDGLGERKNLHLETVLDASLGTAGFDPDKLEKILLNLLFNAIKFTPAGGRIRLLGRGSPETIEITVEDTGPGIPPEHHEKIFDPFWQEDLASTRKFQGAGLGLALVKELTEAHEGAIRVDSPAGGGTRMHLHFPRKPADATSPGQDPQAENLTHEWLSDAYRRAEFAPLQTELDSTGEPAPATPVVTASPDSGPKPTLLIADDEPQMLRFLESELSREFRVLTARDGMQALHLARKHLPDLIILDYMMPALDGLQACRALRAEDATHAIPIILLTARADDETRLQTLDAGATDSLTKPFSSTELTVRCRNLTRLHSIQKDLAAQTASLARSLDELKAAEEQLVHSAKMASLGQLSAGILHEVNNPLNFAQGALRAVQRSLERVPPGEIRGDLADMLGDLGTGLTRAIGIVNGLREFAHPDTVSLGPVALDEVVRTARTMVGHLIDDHVEVSVDVPAEARVHGNRNQLIQVVTNLLHNALDSVRTRAPGEKRAVRLHWSTREDHGELDIWDSGPGISPEIQSRIFEPFFTTKAVGSGVGLGLSTCYRLMQSQGGTIRVESDPGSWCRFVIALPLTISQSNPAGKNPAKAPHAGIL
jgi:signal transduction histidine kinase